MTYRLTLVLLSVFLSSEINAQIFSDNFGTSFGTINTTNWPCKHSSASPYNSSSGSCAGTGDYGAYLQGFGYYYSTKGISIPSTGYTLDFDYSFNSSSFPPVIKIATSSSCYATFNTLQTLTNTSGVCTSKSISLSSYSGQTIYIRFESQSSSTTFYFDDVQVNSGGGGGGVITPGACGSSAIGNRLASINNGDWGTCTTWYDGNPPTISPCTYWASIDLSNRDVIVSHSVTVSTTYSSSNGLGDVENLYVDPTGTMTFNAGYASSHSYGDFDICGTVNINSGTVDFSDYDLVVKSGGVLNISGGVLKVDQILVENGGTINISGSGELTRQNNTNGLTIETGGTINVNGTSAKLRYFGFSSLVYSKIDGTLDVKSSMTSSNSTNVRLGYVSVSSNTSTGRIRTSTAYFPWTDLTITASNNFFGFNSSYGGTVEYYGTSSIFLSSLYSRNQYYDLEVNITGGGGLYLGDNGCTNVVGNLYLKSGNLKTNDKKLILRGTVVYTGSNYIEGSTNGEIVFTGYLSSTSSCTVYTTGITTNIPSSGGTSIYSQGSTVDIKNPELRLSASSGGSATLKTLQLFRDDVVILKSNLTVNDVLDVQRGILKTSSTNLVYVSNSDPASVLHNTTGYSSIIGYVAGVLKRSVVQGNSYVFPVGYPNASDYSTDKTNYRVFALDIITSGSNNIQVNFNPPLSNSCSGSLTASDHGETYASLSTEGYWDVVPDNSSTTEYNATGHIYGFSGLTDNRFGLLKRASGSSLCSDWSNGGGTLNANSTSGRIHEGSGIETGYAQRNGLASFSEFAIGTTNNDINVATCSTFTWTGNTDTDWFTDSNWDCNNVPDETSDVLIPDVSGASNHFPEIVGPAIAKANNITIDASSKLTVSNLNGGRLQIYGDFNNSGSILGTGTISFEGAAPQSLASPLSFGGIINVVAGSTLNTGNQLTMLSGGSLMHGTGTPGAGGDVNGTVTVKRIGSNNSVVYNFWSSPVQSGSVNALGGNRYYYVPANAWDLTEFGLRQGWVPASGTMKPGLGYISTGAGTVSFTGTVNDAPTGTSIKTVIYKNVNAANNVGYNLVGNPFPCSIDADEFISVNGPAGSGVIAGALYFWDDDASGGSGWVTSQDYGVYTGVGFTGPNSGTPFSGHVASCQSFFVEKIANGTDTVRFTNSMRSTTNNAFFKNAPIDRLWISVTNPDNEYNEMLLAFVDDATDGVDLLYDARKLKGNAFISLYSKLGNDDYAIQAFPALTAEKTVQLGLDIATSGIHTLRLKQLEKLDETVTVLLEDKQTGSFQNLRLQPAYTFNATAGTDIQRFALHFNAPMEISVARADCEGNNGIISLNQPGSKEWNYLLTDDQGTLLQSGNHINGSWQFSGLKAGRYHLALNDPYGSQIIKDLEVPASRAVTADFSVSSEQALVNEQVLFTSNSMGANDYFWDLGDGNTISGLAGFDHTYYLAGNYLVKLRAVNEDCEDEITKTISIGIATAISTVPAENFLLFVYPNPNNGSFLVDWPGAKSQDITLQLIAANGKTVFFKETHNRNPKEPFKMFVPQVPAGMYILKAESPSKQIIRKVMVY